MDKLDIHWRGGIYTREAVGDATSDGDVNYDNEVADTIDNAAAVDKGGGLVGIPITGHPFSAADPVTIDDSTNYDGVRKIVSETANEIVITATYQAETFAGTETCNSHLHSNWIVAVGADGEVDLGVRTPTSDDAIFFSERASIVPTGYTPATSHTVGKHWNCYVNPSGGPDDCQGVTITAGFTGRIGINSNDAETPLQLSLAASKQLIYRSNEPTHIKIKTASKTVPQLIHDSASGSLNISGVNDANAIWTLIECYNAGTLEIEDNTKVTDIYSKGTTTIINHETSPACNWYVHGGLVYSDSPVGNVENYGAENMIVGQTTLTNPQEDLDIASVKNYAGIFTWRAAGKMTACKQDGGTINVVGDGDKQIGNSGDTFLLNGGTFDASAQKGALAPGGTCKILIKGGEFKEPAGTEITAFTTGN